MGCGDSALLGKELKQIYLSLILQYLLNYQKSKSISNEPAIDSKNLNFFEATALFHAMGTGNKELVKPLLEKRAEVNKKCNLGYIPLHRAGTETVAELLLA